MINEFKGKYRFLSNFYMTDVMYDGQLWPSSEHAYMAAKTTCTMTRALINSAPTPAEAKKIGRNLVLRPGWEGMKQAVMQEILFDKFSRNLVIKQKLIDTGDQQLVEGNWWGDKIWGVCLKTNQGQNLLGKCLMEIRDRLRPPLIVVVNKHHGAQGVYIGRGSPLGNPFPIGTTVQDSRENVIKRYRIWLNDKIKADDDAVCNALNDIAEQSLTPQGVQLECFCAPKPCHGDVIREVIIEAMKGTP